MDKENTHFKIESGKDDALIIVESRDETPGLAAAIKNTDTILGIVKLLGESDREEIKDPNTTYPLSSVIANLNNLEEIVRNVSENNIHSVEVRNKIVEYLNRIPNNYNLREHTRGLFTNINPVMKKFIF